MQDLHPGGLMILILQKDQNCLQCLPLIDEPTPIKTNITSCIDLIFTDKPGLLVDSGVNHYTQIVTTKLFIPLLILNIFQILLKLL